jgi:thioredoxin 1
VGVYNGGKRIFTAKEGKRKKMKSVNHAEVKDLIKSEGLTVVDCFAEWCGPCKMLKPMLDRISKDYPGVNFVALDIDENADFAAENKIRGVPTLLWYKGGTLVDTTVGVSPEKVLREKLAQHG